MARNYSFVRREMPNFQQMQAAGWDVPLYAYDDPRLGQQIEAARAANQQYGIWADPHGRNPQEFAQLMAGISQRYNPSIMVPDIEFIGKGNQGSAGWNYNQQLAAEWQRLLPNQRTGITVMPNQRDFNYEAWQGIAQEWLPQAYGANPMTDVFDPNQIRQTLIDRGVDPNLINPVLGPGHTQGYQGQHSLWTVDDFIASQLPQAYRGGGPAPAQQPAPGPEPGPGQFNVSQDKLVIPDSKNPRAVEYANRRLGQLLKLGVISEMPSGDPTAAWRQASQGIGAAAQAQGFANPRDFLRSADAKTSIAQGMGRRIRNPQSSKPSKASPPTRRNPPRNVA